MKEATRGLRLLVVDDEEQILELLELTLRMQGYQVTGALSGPSALALATQQQQQQSFEIIVMDVLMAPWDGFETVRQLHQIYQEHMPAVIFLSSLNRSETWPTMPNPFIQEYLVKPFRPFQLIEVIEQVWIRIQNRAESRA